MRAWLFLTATLLLMSCSREKTTADYREGGVPIATAPVINSPPMAERAASFLTAGSPLPSVPAATPAPRRVEAPPSSESSYRAIGTEPFWSVLVKGSRLTLERPDKLPLHFPISRYDDGRTIRYLADGFTMVVSDGPCSDGMSDATWADRVSIAFGEGVLKGCGGAREDF